MQRSDFVYTAILLPLDYLCLIGAGFLAYTIRNTAFVRNLDVVSEVFYQISRDELFTFIGLMAVVWLIFFNFAGLYNPRVNRKFLDQILKIFLACTAGITAVIVFLFFKREFLFSSRFIILAAWGLSILTIILGRSAVRVMRRIFLHYGITAKPIVVVGSDMHTNYFIDQLKKKPAWGYNVVGKVATKEQLAGKLKAQAVHEVIVTDLNYSREKVNDLLEFCQTNHVDFKYATEIYSAHLHNIEMDEIAGFPLIEIKRTPLERWSLVKKRTIDIILSICAITVLCIPGTIITFFIKLTSPGPVFVRLTRVGENGKLFEIYKFRSMVKDAHTMKKDLIEYNERTGPLFKIKNDPRITGLGKFMRRFSIDEIPNFYNVLIGTMSLVGPRPHEPEEVTLYRSHQKKLLNIKPGITGLAQISGRSNLPFDEEAQLDLYYVENWSLKLDFGILLKTPFAVLVKRDGAV